jgi:hypothetical protein
MAHPQGVEGLGMAGPSDTLGSPWPPLAARLWSELVFQTGFILSDPFLLIIALFTNRDRIPADLVVSVWVTCLVFSH